MNTLNAYNKIYLSVCEEVNDDNIVDYVYNSVYSKSIANFTKLNGLVNQVLTITILKFVENEKNQTKII